MRVWLSLGSNITPDTNLRSAIGDLRRMFGELVLSSVYESAAVGFEGAPFLNMVVGLNTRFEPQVLMGQLREIEAIHGRVRDGERKFSSRTLDIDLLTYGEQALRVGRVSLPRDEITRYAFVLLPLSEVAGDEVHPLSGNTYRALWKAFEKTEQSIRAVSLDLE
ncbi:MAG: 2-amino-4-hydroxy-6-hydroxymethyldihydropteridine diphosphokinase [Gammaproteobacteria bacterium]|nr:2-amino-4-hydroxy-6-hydroxymethyldihydropteridine diphosphokinase [Gammaproteobacteria bacterium]